MPENLQCRVLKRYHFTNNAKSRTLNPGLWKEGYRHESTRNFSKTIARISEVSLVPTGIISQEWKKTTAAYLTQFIIVCTAKMLTTIIQLYIASILTAVYSVPLPQNCSVCGKKPFVTRGEHNTSVSESAHIISPINNTAGNYNMRSNQEPQRQGRW